ncbi:hypothetical protein [Clostridium sp.]|uniref:hypothetical protein n=1 Tax=Clostridium sp. TaxID=1506 RepID=UPI00263543A6|nr:hypothetical protein [Clostridium sp.]
MKKIIIYGITILISASIPIYFLLIWEPLSAKDVIGSDISLNKESIKELDIGENLNINNIEIYNENVFSNFDNITLEKRERLNRLIKSLAIEDMIKINNYFKDLKNNENIIKGIKLIEKRMTQGNYQEFREIIKDYITLEEEI